MKVIAMLTRSAGNDSVGSMWTETRVFNDTDSVGMIMVWARNNAGNSRNQNTLKDTLTLQHAEGSEEEQDNGK